MKLSLGKIINRLGRNLEGPRSNFVEQFRYGHREILVLYAGLSPDMAIRGSLEHGWSPFGPSVGVPKLLGGRFLHLAWSSINMKRNSLHYPKNVKAIGAPFLYLLKLMESLPRTQGSIKRKFLFIPPHGGETSVPELKGLLDQYVQQFDPTDSSVQLYWTEFVNPIIRDAYDKAGFEVTCAGFCGLSLNEGLAFSTRERAISSLGSRNVYLFNILRSLEQHDEVVAGTFGTSTLYAGYLKKPVHLLQAWNNFQSKMTIDKYGRIYEKDMSEQEFYLYLQSEVARHFSQNLKSNIEDFYLYCAQELGESDLLSSFELCQLVKENSFSIMSNEAVLGLKESLARN